MAKAETNIPWLALCAAVVARDWEPLRDAVLRVISRVGGKTALGLSMINQCLHNGLLELGLMAPDDTTWRQFSRTDCEHLTIRAPLIHPAEGVRVEPYEDGYYFIRRASHAEPTSPASEPAARAEETASPVEPTPLAEPKQPAPERAATRRGRRGPRRGTIDRFAQPDRALFPEMTTLIEQRHITPTEAARLLFDKIEGRGASNSRIRRLAERYRREVGKLTSARRDS